MANTDLSPSDPHNIEGTWRISVGKGFSQLSISAFTTGLGMHSPPNLSNRRHRTSSLLTSTGLLIERVVVREREVVSCVNDSGLPTGAFE